MCTPLTSTTVAVIRCCRAMVRQVSCHYTKVLAKCGRDGADWQKHFTQRLTDVLPNVLEQVVHPDGDKVTSLLDCNDFKRGKYQLEISGVRNPMKISDISFLKTEPNRPI